MLDKTNIWERARVRIVLAIGTGVSSQYPKTNISFVYMLNTCLTTGKKVHIGRENIIGDGTIKETISKEPLFRDKGVDSGRSEAAVRIRLVMEV